MSQITPRVFPYIQVDQPIGTFFIAAIPACEILPLLAIERRGLTAEEQLKVQRALDTGKQKEIADYVTRQPDATFPTSVTLSANTEYVHILEESFQLVIGVELDDSCKTEDFEEKNILKIGNHRYVSVPDEQPIAIVIDGQHRIEGLRLAGAGSKSSKLATFNIPFVFMFDLSPEDMAKIFVTINSTQRKVDRSLISDLFGLSSRRSPQRTCHLIAVALNNAPNGPFYNGLKMLGRRESGTEFLSQGSFCKYLLLLISRKPEDDERNFNNGILPDPDKRAPLRQYFLNGKDEIILYIVTNYFTAISIVYSKAWIKEPNKHLLRKTVGFSALIRLLINIIPVALQVKEVSLDAFVRVFEEMKRTLPDSEFGVTKFSSSEADATKMFKLMYATVESPLPILLKGDDHK